MTAFPGGGGFPLLCANLDEPSLPFVVPSVLKDVGGVKVGVFGLLTPYDAMANRNATIRGQDPAELLRIAGTQAAQLRAAGAQVVVLLSHLGVDLDRAIAASVPGLDAIVGGHDHYSIAETVNGVPIVHAGAYYREVGRVKLSVGPGGASLVSRELVEVDAGVPRLPPVAAAVAQVQGYVRWVFAPVLEEATYGLYYRTPIATATEDVTNAINFRRPSEDRRRPPGRGAAVGREEAGGGAALAPARRSGKLNGRSHSGVAVIRLEDIGRAVRETEYAVRGPIVARAQELERQGRRVVYCNIGNPQSLGQRPLTWVRQVLSLVEYPELLGRVPAGSFPADVVETARLVLRGTQHGVGAYTESKGYRFVREAVAEFVRARDGIASDPEAIFLTDGASKAVQGVLRILLSDSRDGILIPIPQYPLYSATITLYGGALVPYHLDEAHEWSLSRDVLQGAIEKARAAGVRPRGIVVINPGNPTGAVLDARNVEMVLGFAREHGLAVLADEVYQDDVYLPGDRFVSFASALERRKERDVSLFSFHSTSKGYLGECGHRGGYVECRNVPGPVLDEVTKLQSVSLCANSMGQVLTYLLVRPPRPGDPSFALWDEERRGVLEQLRRKAEIVGRGLNAVPGIRCNKVAGAMYAFPRIELPPGVTDDEWCMALLEETGICVVPGSGFGQDPGTHHFRTTILPPLDEIESVVKRIGEFHAAFTRRASAAARP